MGVCEAAAQQLMAELNRGHAASREGDQRLDARIRSYELAARMQLTTPEIVDISKESKATLDLYGVGGKDTNTFGRACLLARKLSEAGVRFVQVYYGNGQPWDSHSNHDATTRRLAADIDRPIAALLGDLKQRGLLDSTIVLWTGEFGRLPVSQGTDGRDHNRHAFSLWLAGGGFRHHGAPRPAHAAPHLHGSGGR